MFFQRIPLYSRIMFIGITALECLLAIMLLRWDAWKRYPVMSAYLTWQGVSAAANLLIALFGTIMTYVYVYYLSNILLNLIAFVAALELYYKFFDPRLGLFAWGRRHVVIIMSISLALAILLGCLLAARNGGSFTRTMMTLNAIMSVTLWATFSIILIYSRSLGFTWRPRAAGIALGFILYCTVAVVCIFIEARWSLKVAAIANQVNMAAEFLAVAWWLGVFWGDENIRQTAIPTQAEEMPPPYGETLETVARML
jgi:MFS family permease